MSDRVAVSIADGVADVRLNRPDKMNALDQAMFDALIETGEQLARMQDLNPRSPEEVRQEIAEQEFLSGK
jgi:enoyl-CoA hydratase/carnithine racemase